MMEDLSADLDAIASIEAVPRILEVVCRTTGLGFAAVARVTDSRWMACAVRDQIAFGLEPGGELPVRTTICDEIRQHGQAVIIDDVIADERFCRHPTPERYGFRSYVSVPIVLSDGRFFGTLCAIDPGPARLSASETMTMFALFAELIAFHLDAHDRVVDLEARVAQRTSALETLNRQLDRTREDERTRIARELHDDLGQGLSALRMDLDEARLALADPLDRGRVRVGAAIDSMVSLTEGALDSVERIVSELRPAVLDALGVAAAIDWLALEFARRTTIKTACACEEDRGLTPEAATVLFRIAQEALTNVAKHAGASEVGIAMAREDNEIVLIVTDNGCGIRDGDLDALTAYGIRGMRERLRAVDGSLSITPADHGGTRLVARCPRGQSAVA